jgi:hypothetical protein
LRGRDIGGKRRHIVLLARLGLPTRYMPYRLLTIRFIRDFSDIIYVRLKTGHREPKIPKVVRLTEGKMSPKTAPGRALRTRIGPTSE